MERENAFDVSPLAGDRKTDGGLKLSRAQAEYMAFLRRRLNDAKSARDQVYDEFDGGTYLTRYDENLKGANAYLKPKKNPEDTVFSTGTTRQAVLALIANVRAGNFTAEVMPYDREDRPLADLGKALELVVHGMKAKDGDDAKQLLRFWELFTQGDAFVMQDWVEEFRVEKPKRRFDGKWRDEECVGRLKKVFEGCRRRLIPGRRMFLGSMFCDDFRNQPFVFEWDKITYAEARQLYGAWDNFRFVKEGGRFEASDEMGSYMESWSLSDVEAGEVEVIRYYDRHADEFQIVLNGTPMLPIGFPMPWEHGEYPVVHGWFEPIRSGFSYHNSIVRRMRNAQLLEDEVWRNIILMFQKSVFRPLLNNTGRNLTRRVQLPGAVTFGVSPDQLRPLEDGSPGVTSGMTTMAQMTRKNLDDNSIPEIKRGQFSGDRATATEIMQVQREAEIAMSLSANAAQRLEEGLDALMVADVVQYALRPGSVHSTRTATDAGLMENVIEVIKGSPEPRTPERRKADSIEMYRKEHEGGVRVSRRLKIYSDVKDVIGRVSVRSVSKPKPSSAADKIAFDQMIQRAFSLFGRSIEAPFWQDMFGQVWGVNPDRAFRRDASDMTSLLAPQKMSAEARGMAESATGAKALPDMQKVV
jgi:hypothetical protein